MTFLYQSGVLLGPCQQKIKEIPGSFHHHFGKPDPDPHPGFASRSKAGSGSASKSKVGSGSALQWKAESLSSDPIHWLFHLLTFSNQTWLFLAQFNHPLTLCWVQEPWLLGRSLLDRTQPGFTHSLRLARRFVEQKDSFSSVVDPWHFGTDPDPRIRASGRLIQIRLRILLFSSLTFKTPIKN